jgi:hypothetical protein
MQVSHLNCRALRSEVTRSARAVSQYENWGAKETALNNCLSRDVSRRCQMWQVHHHAPRCLCKWCARRRCTRKLVLFKCNGSIGTASRRRAALAYTCINKARRKHLYYWCQCVKYAHGNNAHCNMAPCVARAPRTQHLFSSPARPVGDTALLAKG